MCYIIVKKSTQSLPADYVAGARNLGNDDGAGLMYVEDGRVVIEKSLTTTEESVRALWDKHCGRSLAFHLRNKSVGPRTEENVHPFWVTNKDWGHERDIAFMHNGTVASVLVDASLSDSANIATYHLRPILAKHPELYDSTDFWHVISAFVGFNKFVLLDSNEKFIIVNAGVGQVLNGGIWVSSKVSVTPAGKSKSSDFSYSDVPTLSPERIEAGLAKTSWFEEDDGTKHLRVTGAYDKAALIKIAKDDPERLVDMFISMLGEIGG